MLQSSRIDDINRKFQQLIGSRDSLLRDREVLDNKQKTLASDIAEYKEARTLLELFIKSTEIRIKDYIEPLVNEALTFVFQQELDFRLIFAERRNQIEVDFIIMRDSIQREIYDKYYSNPEKYKKEFAEVVNESKNINYNYGGAVNQVLSLVLRLILVELLKIEGPLVLDEPTSACSEEYSAKVGQLLNNLSYRFKRQYIVITHSTQLANYADKTYLVTKPDTISEVRLSN